MKTEILNVFRTIFKIPLLERGLRKLVRGKDTKALVSRLVPNNYQYPPNTVREYHYNGIRLRLDIHDYIGHWLYFGFRDISHEKLLSLVKPGDLVLDIGTNVGTTILQLAKRVGKNGMTFGFEPDPINFEVCQRNLDLNDRSNIFVEQIGLGSQTSKVTLVVDTESNRGGNRVGMAKNGQESNEISIQRLEDWVISQAISGIDLIKIDVEGYEMEVLKGAESVLTRFRPILFIELDDNNLNQQKSSAVELVHFLESMNYSIVQSETNKRVTQTDDFSKCHFDIVCTHLPTS